MVRRRTPDPAAPAAPSPPKRPVWLIAVGLAAALVIAVATLPASLFGSRLSRMGVDAASLSGSVWAGTARGLSWQSTPVGDLRWSITPWSLLLGRVSGDLDLARLDGSARARFSVTFTREIRLTDVQADLPVALLSALPLGVPRGWQGRLSGQIEELVVREGWPAALRGTFDMDRLIAPPPRSTSIGSYRVVIPDPQASDVASEVLTAHVADKEGPFSFEGSFTLGPDRSFLLEGTLAPRGATPPALVRSLELLGPADAAGRRPVSVSGTL